MSQENVSLVRDLYERLPGLLEAAPEDVDSAFRNYLDDPFEFHLPPDYPEGEQVIRGREGMNALIASFRETWSEWRFVPERFLDADDRVVVFAHLCAVGHESNAPIEIETTHVWTIRDGRVKSGRVYRSRSEALAAVGLSE